jgi:hypothetical protein
MTSQLMDSKTERGLPRRRSWGRVSAVALVGTLAATMTAPLRAHQLDEYVGLTHVAVSRTRVGLSVSLTPGAEIVGPIIAAIDRNGDGELAVEEQQLYARKILSNLSLRVDGEPAEIGFQSISFPHLELLQLGRGVIQFEMDAAITPLTAGTHVVSYQNGNSDELSVYLVNALRPDTPGVRIKRQTRDWLQTQIDIEVEISDIGQEDNSAGGVVAGLLVAVAALGGLAVARRRTLRRA